MNKVDDKLSLVFNQIRFPLIVLVVFIHCKTYPVHYNEIDFSALNIGDFFNLTRLAIGDIIAQFAVPSFFLISGYLFFIGLEKWDWNKYCGKLKKRIKSLLVPFIIWNAIAIVVFCFSLFLHNGLDGVKEFITNTNLYKLFWSYYSTNAERVNEIGLHTPMSFPFLVPLWYLRELMVMVLISPAIYLIIRYLKWGGVILLMLSYVLGLGINIPGFLSTAIFFYGLGAFFRVMDIDILGVLNKYRTLIVICTIILTVVSIRWFCIRGIVWSVLIIFGVATLFIISAYFVNKGKRIPDYLINSTFFIFLSHDILITSVSSNIVARIIGTQSALQLLIHYCFTAILTLLICVCLYQFLKKTLPSILSVITGGRL